VKPCIPALGGRVVGLTEATLGADDRRNIDDAAPAPFHHALAHRLRHIEHRIEIGPDHRVPIDLVQLLEAGVSGNASVVDEDVDRTQVIPDFLRTLLTGIVVAHVDRIRAKLSPIGDHPREPTLDARIVRRIGDHHGITGVNDA
jgi:hypothetical protein